MRHRRALRTIGMSIRNTTRGSGTLLFSLALLLALHPLSGSSLGNGEGIAALIKALVCGCEVCADEATAVETAQAESCCHEEPAPDEEDCEGKCPCSHPEDVPLPGPTPLCAGPRAGIDGSMNALVAQCAELSAATPDPFHETFAEGVSQQPPGVHPPDQVAGFRGEALGIADGPRVRLAVLCTALI